MPHGGTFQAPAWAGAAVRQSIGDSRSLRFPRGIPGDVALGADDVAQFSVGKVQAGHPTAVRGSEFLTFPGLAAILGNIDVVASPAAGDEPAALLVHKLDTVNRTSVDEGIEIGLLPCFATVFG